MSNVDISIIIVSWNVRELLRANLRRLFSVPTKLRYEVFVVDNGSHDGSAYMVRSEFPEVKLITNAWDAGFAGPNNQALRLAKGDVCLLLNPDMLVEEGALDATHEKLMQDKTVGVLGIKLIGQDGKPINSVRRDPDFWSQLAIMFKVQHVFPNVIRRYLRNDFDYQRSQDVDHVRGSFFAFRRETLREEGYLDPGFHIWFEEVDFCKRVREKGMRVFYLADVQAHDFVGKGVSQMQRFETQWIFTSSMLRYFRKWFPAWQWMVLAGVRPIGLFLALCADGVNGLKKKMV